MTAHRSIIRLVPICGVVVLLFTVSSFLMAQEIPKVATLIDGREYVGDIATDTAAYVQFKPSNGEIRNFPAGESEVRMGRRMEADTIIVSGRLIVGSFLKRVNGYVQIRTTSGDRLVIPRDSVRDVTSYQLVREIPTHPFKASGLDVELPWTCGRRFSWWFVELRFLGMETDHWSMGAEGVVGVRPGKFAIGVGVSWIKLQDVAQVPVFLHPRYTLSEGCLRPFVYADAGYVFNSCAKRYGVAPSISGFTKPAPKMFGLGLGLDYSISRAVDLSVDAGYRYLTVADERYAPACTPVHALAYDEIHAAVVRIGLTF